MNFDINDIVFIVADCSKVYLLHASKFGGFDCYKWEHHYGWVRINDRHNTYLTIKQLLTDVHLEPIAVIHIKK